MRSSGLAALAAYASVVSAQTAVTTSIDVDAISVAVPTTVFNLPVVYVTAENAPAITATTLATSATAASDPSATNVFDSAADVSEALSSVAAEATATAVEKRLVAAAAATCVTQPSGIDYNVSPDDAATFAQDVTFSNAASNAITPNGYTLTFAGLTASNSADNYMGYTLLPSYDVATCGAKCNAITGCNSFNIYFERDPSLNPDSDTCADPASSINIKCVFWGGAVTADNANNFGQWRNKFQVLISGSNGYVNTAYVAALTKTKVTTASPADETNDAGSIYTIYYSSDSTRGSYTNAAASKSYQDCETACDADTSCNAFTYVGGSNGVGSGTCWLKTELGSPSKAGSNVISGKKNGKVNKLTILSAYWADWDVTAKSLTTLKSGNNIVINTDHSTLISQFGGEAWAGVNTVFTVLYSNGTKTGVFVAQVGSGTYTLSGAGDNSAPKCEDVAALASSSTAKIVSVVYGQAQITIQSTYSKLLSLVASKSSFQATNGFFGIDNWWGTKKSWVIFYYNTAGVLSARSGKEDDWASFP